MNWLELHIDTTNAFLETLEAALSAMGVDGLVIDDETEFQDFLENNHQYWDYVDEDLEKSMAGKSRVTFYLEANDDGLAKVGEVRIALEQLKAQHTNCGTLLMTMNTMQNEDWENNWKQYYKPMEIGERLLVIPEWEQAEEKGRVPLILDPGLTFGTGSHATTRLCLTALEKAIQGNEKVLDLGCGSGIYQDTYTVKVGDILGDESVRAELGGGYDIVLANIVSDVIIALAPMVHSLLKEGGLFLCSGIIDTRAEEVKGKLLEAGLEILAERSSEGWFAFSCR